MSPCPVCGTSDSACGDPYTGTPVDEQIINPPERGPVMSDQNEMLRVEVAPGDVRRVNPRDKDQFMAANPGAKVLGEQTEDEAPEAGAKAMDGPPANKARQMGTSGGEKK